MDRNKAKAYWRRFTIRTNIEGQLTDVMDFNNFVNAITEWENSSRVGLPVIRFAKPTINEVDYKKWLADLMNLFFINDKLEKYLMDKRNNNSNSNGLLSYKFFGERNIKMEIEVEWNTKPKSGITSIDIKDLGCKTKKEWHSLDKEEQKKRLMNALTDYELGEVKFVPTSWDE
jgi:hypothetical protein